MIQREALDSPIQAEEVKEKIKTTKPNKAPGPNGFTAQFYKSFLNKLEPKLTTLCNYCAKSGSTSPLNGRNNYVSTP